MLKFAVDSLNCVSLPFSAVKMAAPVLVLSVSKLLKSIDTASAFLKFDVL